MFQTSTVDENTGFKNSRFLEMGFGNYRIEVSKSSTNAVNSIYFDSTDCMCCRLPLQLQYVLLRDLLCLSSNDADQNFLSPALHHNLNVEQLRDEQIFSISLYHRWTLRIIVNSPMVSKNILFCTTA